MMREGMNPAKHVYRCIQCGVCSAVCPVVDLMDMEPRRLVGLLMDTGVALPWAPESLRVCTGCYLCSDQCPQKVPVAEIFRELREKIRQTEYSPSSLDMTDLRGPVMKQITRYGRLYDIPAPAKTSFQQFSTTSFNKNEWKQFQRITRVKIRKKNIAGMKDIRTLLKQPKQNTDIT